MKMRRILSLVLALSLVLGLAPARPAAAAAGSVFSDVSEDNWACAAILDADRHGVMTGMGTDATGRRIFNPTAVLHLCELTAILTRAFYPQEVSAQGVADPWYAASHQVALSLGLYEGLPQVELMAEVTREEMAVIMYRVMVAQGAALPSREQLDVVSGGIPDLAEAAPYARDAIAACYSLGLLTGTDQYGSFTPAGNTDRQTTAVIYTRLRSAIAPQEEGDPAQPDPGDSQAEEDILTVAGQQYYIGMPEDRLIQLAGTPGETLSTFSGYTWYVYGTETYENFLLAGVAGGEVVALCSSGTGFSYRGASMGAAEAYFYDSDRTRVCAMLDRNDGDILHCVMLTAKSYRDSGTYNETTLYDESRVNFHLVNAFRQYHGLPALLWSEPAHTSARLHSEDMAEKGYFDHVAEDGSAPGDRMRRQGISWHTCGENIAAGYGSGVNNHDGWVNSAGHRSNILGRNWTHLGVGMAYNPSSFYRSYATENFFA